MKRAAPFFRLPASRCLAILFLSALLVVLTPGTAALAQQTGMAPVPAPPRPGAPAAPRPPAAQPSAAHAAPTRPGVAQVAPPQRGLPAAARSQQAALMLEFETVQDGGRIAVAIYQDAESFRRSERPVRTMMVDRSGPVTRAWVLGLAPGRYAVAAFHDLDSDGKLAKWPFGMPREPYGFSNDARGRFGPPAFDLAAFDLPAGGATHRIRLH